MTKQFFTLILFCTALSSYVFSQQKTTGVIYYDQTIDFKAMTAQQSADGQQRRIMMGGNMPDKITNKFEIIFNPNGAKLQKSVIEDNAAPAEGATGGGGMTMMRFGGGADREVFFTGSTKITESFELSGEPVLLEAELGNQSKEAELSTETRKIIGFDCKKATITGRNGSKTTIWYTNALPLKASPMPAMWTEGVVLGIENERMKYFATSIEYSKVKDSEVATPKKGRVITQEEYQKKMEEMRSRFRGNGPAGQREIRIQQ
ncbi:MAG: GLPGLI family protein [Sphingobacteriaceae bacterium]